MRTLLTLLLLAVATPAAAKAPKVTLMTFNLPAFPADVGKKKNKDKRVKRFVKRLKALDHKPDVVALQEVWDDSDKREIRQKLKDIYPHAHLDTSAGKHGLLLNSGLMLLSRWPLSDTRLRHYKANKGLEKKAAKKGVLGARISPPGGKPFWVFATHLQAQSKDRHNRTKLKQLGEARDAIRAATAGMTRGTVFLVGDFNLSVEKNNATLQAAYALFPGVVDTYDAARTEATGSTWAGLDDPGKRQRIDHIWVLNGAVSGASWIVRTFDKDVSDHLAYWGEFDGGSFR
ncbi:MAG: endonuclease/exonuclease/phosphatase family protein [Myxococcales bacterium]|nr:endonuclease/exonuclease/phosphatase family protein [Myxococcales bacterium]MCB9525402.1 endonuclease/exonuclease/phosphatase family protein [Myxococcales bacterium]